MDIMNEISIDLELNSAYIQISKGEVARTVSITSEINLDLKEDSSVLGIELLDLDADLPFALLSDSYKVEPTVLEMIHNLIPNLKQTKLFGMTEGTSRHQNSKNQLASA
jgi:uncharacterized protein YuzE